MPQVLLTSKPNTREPVEIYRTPLAINFFVEFCIPNGSINSAIGQMDAHFTKYHG